MPKTGDRRFQCQCGEIFADGVHVMQHLAQGHAVVMERYSLGQWYFNRQVVMEQIVQLLIDKGVDVAHVVANVERYALELEAQARGWN